MEVVEVMVVIKVQSQSKHPSWCYGGCRHRSVMGAWVVAGGWWDGRTGILGKSRYRPVVE